MHGLKRNPQDCHYHLIGDYDKVTAICMVITAISCCYKMLWKHLMKVVDTVHLVMGEAESWEVKRATQGHLVVQWHSQIPAACSASTKWRCIALQLRWNLIYCTLQPLFPAHVELYLLEPQPSKFSVILSKDTCGFISCSCLDLGSLCKYVCFTVRFA